MKKLLLLTCAFLLALTTCVACSTLPAEGNHTMLSGDPIYTVLIYDYSDSVESAKHEIEFQFADLEKYSSKEPAEEIEVSINGQLYKGVWQMTQYRDYNYYPVHRYLDSNGIEFEIDESNTLVSCFWGKTNNDLVLTEEECTKVAVEFMKNIIDVNQYRVSVEKNDERQKYIIEFNKYIGDIKTTDSATVEVLYSGDLYCYSSHMLGKVSVSNKNNVKIDDVIASVYAKLDTVYADTKSNYSRVEYKTPELMITTLTDGSQAYVCTIVVQCINTSGEFDTVVSERLNLVIETN
ncbi:MAG: hypothetical protein IKA46_05625 [Clostridia bacterium]|nr:hypothetical protein [Clostridia bacterium]